MGADAVVIGAGVIGSSIALELARSGRRVVVVDRAGGIGHGSTSASSAVIRYSFSTLAGVVASWEAHFAWVDWRAHLGHDVGPLARFERCGLVMVDAPAAPRSSWLPLFDAVGVPYEAWDAAEFERRLPGLDHGRYWPPKRLDDDAFWVDAADTLGAVFTPDAGFVTDPQLAAQNLAAAAMREGARFRLRSTVTAVDSTGGRVRAVELADGTRLFADTVVNAAGPWSGRINEIAGVGGDFTIGVRPLRQEVAYTPSAPGWDGPIVADLDLGTYFRRDLRGGLLIGGTEPECDPLQWLDDPDDAAMNPTKPLFEAHVTRAARRLPGLGVPEQPRGIVGVYDVADDWNPIYDRTELPGFYVAIGTSGNQFKNAPLVGQLMTTLIDAVESGADPATVDHPTPHTNIPLPLAAFSRNRPRNPNSNTVFG
ncbi:FAD-binding oxidoreductase [Nocardia panacis]|uniref:FAD-binding oxidoreductase n=1 Tax=Nocardia panacis TaxID=2340916 RepID=A0A3A4KSS9_9NOCA|nr:FAD-dependent oxidoreductase [Nocardia panacis]RJO79185.1 FAD-binding oxidoreductase [Nocardia panacis]